MKNNFTTEKRSLHYNLLLSCEIDILYIDYFMSYN